jgi:CMP-N,N'-diacetyllegionaminic acid synthase
MNKVLKIALIPARSGSKRVAGKNVRPIAGHPVMAYTITTAINSGIFDAIVVSTDSDEYASIAVHYGAEVPFLRPVEFSGDTSPDIEWVQYTLERLRDMGRQYDVFSILRPTSPFRMPETICRAWETFILQPDADSLRAVEKCKQHPGKMWLINGSKMQPLVSPEMQEKVFGTKQTAVPWHSSQYQALPEVYVQNASLEIAWSRVVFETRTITGEKVIPFLTLGYEGFDVNHLYDWELAEKLVLNGEAKLPEIVVPSYCFGK